MRDIRKITSPSFLKGLTLKEKNELSDSIRSFLIEELSNTGGHLGANLGVVELTIALHSVFNSPTDKFIWDVGHQAYVHKILTGRAIDFPTLREYGGLSGFQKRLETKHDIWGSGHSSTSLSAAIGLATARDIQNQNYDIIPIIGDGALTGGMAFEALNHLGDIQKNVKVVINDNGMSISKNVGALQKVLNTAREKSRTNQAKQFFELLGFQYLGPVDGHCFKSLICNFEKAQSITRPVIIHVLTQKGKGFSAAERDGITHYHGVGPYHKVSGQIIKKNVQKSWSEVVSSELCRLAQYRKDFLVFTPAMIIGSKLEKFAEDFPERVFDTAIAEQHTVTLSGGVAVGGIKPIVAIYSTFLQRAYDQIIHDICRQKLPVFFCIDRAGLVGADGDTHHGLFDIAFLRSVPNLVIMMPSSIEQCIKMIQFGLNYKDSPIAIRFPRGQAISEQQLIDSYEELENPPIKDFTWRVLKKGDDLAIITFGPQIQTALDAANELKEHYKLNISVVDARFITPLDTALMNSLIHKNIPLITIEEGILAGGFGSAVLEYISKQGPSSSQIVERMGVKNEFVEHGSITHLLENINLTKTDIIRRVVTIIHRKGGTE